MKIYLANPRGFCAGVDRAIEIVERAIEKHGPPIYVRHEVVHNKFVVEDLKSRGAIFVEEIDEIPDESLVIFSAHGVSNKVEIQTKERNLNFYDATCPLVTKVHMEVVRNSRAGRDIILIGHEGHPEVEGTMGRHINKENSFIYLVQDEDEAKNTTETPLDNREEGDCDDESDCVLMLLSSYMFTDTESTYGDGEWIIAIHNEKVNDQKIESFVIILHYK